MDVTDVRVIWSDPTRGKAKLREESLDEHLSRPIAERLATALALVRSPPADDRGV
ncbi:MAG: hypothetical protein KF819_14095 [Labilithrix sp.]|nr:hypothetical protein [Labilithrix sp.]